MEVSIHQLTGTDITEFRALIQIYTEVFGMEDFKPVPDSYLLELLQQPHFVVFVVKNGDEILGGLTIYLLQPYYATKGIAYIYDFAIATAHQRKGFGSRLMDHVKMYCKSQQLEEVYVQAEAIDRHAINFYRNNNPSEELEVIHFNFTTSA